MAFVDIYSRTTKVSTVALLELLKSPFLREIFGTMKYCDLCSERMVIIFPEEQEEDLTDAFKSQSEDIFPAIEDSLFGRLRNPDLPGIEARSEVKVEVDADDEEEKVIVVEYDQSDTIKNIEEPPSPPKNNLVICRTESISNDKLTCIEYFQERYREPKVDLERISLTGEQKKMILEHIRVARNSDGTRDESKESEKQTNSGINNGRKNIKEKLACHRKKYFRNQIKEKWIL